MATPININNASLDELSTDELTPKHIEQYLELKWGRDESGNLQAMEGTHECKSIEFLAFSRSHF